MSLKIHVSIGTAGVLGLAQVPMAVAPTTAYLMVGGRCAMNCAFCAQARESTASDLSLSRVIWPRFLLDQVCAHLREAERQGTICRCCIQTTTGRDYYPRVLDVVRRIRQAVSLPVSVSVLPASMAQVAQLYEAGVDRIGFGLDAASERVFQRVKGTHWKHMLALVQETGERFPDRLSVHLIVGLGETEREMVERMLWLRQLGAGIGLFAFTPVRGTAMSDRPPPALASYRRMQACRWLMVKHGMDVEDCSFDERDVLVGFRWPHWSRYLATGEPFRTAGCPGCNRPFYNERPGHTLYNYARLLTGEEACQAIQEMELSGHDD
jgi:biotin synthase-related radical SAM superfamily protein